MIPAHLKLNNKGLISVHKNQVKQLVQLTEHNKLVAAFIVEEMQPLSLWRRLHFVISSAKNDRQKDGWRAAPSQNLYKLFGQCIYGNGDRPEENLTRSMDCSE